MMGRLSVITLVLPLFLDEIDLLDSYSRDLLWELYGFNKTSERRRYMSYTKVCKYNTTE